MRVLQVVSSLNIGSGIANFILNYYRNVDREKVQFDFLLFFEAEKNYHEEVEKLGGKIYIIPSPSLKTFSAYDKQVKAFFAEHKNEWECVHIHEILVQKFIIKHSKPNGVRKVFMHSHNTAFVLPRPELSVIKRYAEYGFKKLRNVYLLSGFKNKTDGFIACSNAAGVALYGKKILLRDDFLVINNAVDTNKFITALSGRDRLREEYNVTDKKVILHVGKFCEHKNQPFLLKTFEKIYEKDDSYVLFMVGIGPTKSAMEEQYSSLKEKGAIKFLGSRTDIADLMAIADLFFFPSINEGLPVSLIEAQASGLPCVASASISTEAIITPAVKYLDLAIGEEKWAEEILATPLIRYDTKQSIIEHGYDITASSQKLVELYLK